MAAGAVWLVQLSGRAESFQRAFGVFLRSLVAVLQGRAALFDVFRSLWRGVTGPHSPAGFGGRSNRPEHPPVSTDVV